MEPQPDGRPDGRESGPENGPDTEHTDPPRLLRERRRRKKSRALPITAGVIAAVLVLGAAYGAADAYDVVPGVLTVKPETTIDPLPQPRAQAQAKSAGKALGDDAPVPDALRGTMAPLLATKAVKGKIGIEIRDAATNKVLYSKAAGKQKTPASVTKLLTASASLGIIGADTTFTTSADLAAQDGAKATVNLTGGGDILLGAGASDPNAVAGHGGLGTLGARAAKALKAKGVTTVTVRPDVSRYKGPTFSKAWSRGDIANGYINPITPLMIDAAKLGAGEHAPRSADPAGDAAKAFAKALEKAGLTVKTGSAVTAGAKSAASAGTTTGRLAQVKSAPLVTQIQYMLLNSDNTAAEVLGVEVARAMGLDASIAAAPKGVIKGLQKLGLSTGSIHLGDTSGLDYSNRISPHELAAIVQKDATATDSLSQVIPNLPVSGLSGTLADRYHDTSSKRAAGIVSAKTGTLATVNSLGGIVPTADGRLLVFALMSDGLAAGSADTVRKAYDAAVARLADCGCGS